MKKIILFILFIGINTVVAVGQNTEEEAPPANKEKIELELKRNRRKTRINNVYIPKSVDDAIVQLEKLSNGKSLEKFKNAPEENVAKKLHFGIGNWMIVNWNFYGGSRFEKVLRDLGLGHPDDMADFMIIVFHRHLNGRKLETEELAKTFHEKRLKEYRKKHKVIKVIKKKK